MAVSPEELDSRWIAWLREWMRRGGDMSLAVAELRRVGFADRAIVSALEASRPRGNALAQGAMRSLPLIRRAPPELRRLDAPFPVYTLDDFLAAGECADLIRMIDGHFKPSPVVSVLSDAEFRTSSTANLYEIDDPKSSALEEKIARTLGIRPSYGEGIQAQRYLVGQQYKPHY